MVNVNTFCKVPQVGTGSVQELRRLALVAVVVVVLTLTRIMKSVVTGQAPVTLELSNTPGKNTHNTQPKVVHAYITADAIHASTRNI